MLALLNSTTILQNEPNLIVKPIAIFLGWILNFIYNFTFEISQPIAFGLSIIIFTMIVRSLMIPLAIKQQKSMAKMQQLQPEMEKIKKKYGSSKDPEVQKKITQETQQLYQKSGVNPLGGCFPILIQFPIFIALSYIMMQSYLFIDKMGVAYRGIASLAMQVTPNWIEAIRPLAEAKVMPNKKFDIGVFDNLQKLFYSFSKDDWAVYLARVPANIKEQMIPFVDQIDGLSQLTYLFSINLLKNPELMSVGILIPILSALATFLSSWILMKQQVSTDPNVKMQQRIMLIMMPIMMGYFTFTFPAGVGLYWISSSVFQLIQQLVLNKYYSVKKASEKKEA